jgi:ABC-type polysaccharide/polyol phosphate export permease
MTDSNTKSVRSYEAGRSVSGPIDACHVAWQELSASRHVIWHLFKRDFVAGFRQKLLGYLWIVIAPLLGIASFVFMNWTGILNPGETPIPYPIYVFMGTGMWGLLISALSTVSGGLLGNAELVIRTNIPKIAFAITGMAHLCYGLVINMVVLLIIFAAFRTAPSLVGFAVYPLVILPIIVLGMGIGLLLAVIGAVARDISGMVGTVIGLVMYVTPVVYTAEFADPNLRLLVDWNPLTYLVDTPRSLFVLGTMPHPLEFALSSLLAFTILFLSVYGFYLIKDKVAERL